MTRLLYRVIATHLLVAVPPAVFVGWKVVDLNRSALLLEIQHLNLAVASRTRDALSAHAREAFAVLDSAERILDMNDVPVERRQDLLRVLVARGGAPYLAIYRPDGALDSTIAPKEARPATPSKDDLAALENRDHASGTPQITAERTTVPLFLAWKGFGVLGTELELSAIDALLAESLERQIGDGGELDVVDQKLRVLASTVPNRRGTISVAIGEDSARALGALVSGESKIWTAPDGQRRLTAVISAPELGWLVVASRPEAIALAPLAEARKRTVLIAIAAALAAGFVGLLLARTVSEPVRRLRDGVRASMRAGAKDAIPDRSGALEIRELVRAFNELLRDLAKYRTTTRRDSLVQLRLARFLSPELLRAAMTQEREVATSGREVLATLVYADVTRQTILEASLRPEQIVSILGDFFAEACAAVEQHGGRVDRFSGNAVIGVFAGSSSQHQGANALAAANAIVAGARSIAERWSQATFACSIGVATGKSILAELESAGGEVSVIGETVERAAALSDSAGPNEIATDPQTRGAVEVTKEMT